MVVDLSGWSRTAGFGGGVGAGAGLGLGGSSAGGSGTVIRRFAKGFCKCFATLASGSLMVNDPYEAGSTVAALNSHTSVFSSLKIKFASVSLVR